LIHLPELYSNFVEDEYKAVFAIALPYTNPFRFVTVFNAILFKSYLFDYSVE
jgi:hypothetical protein